MIQMNITRISLGAAIFVLSALIATAAEPFKVGIQTWTLREMNFDQVVEFALKHHVKYLEMIDKHINPKGPVEETKRKKAILDKNGLVCYTFGVAGTSKQKEENRKLFEFAKLMGIKLIVVEPGDMAIWDNLEELVKEYDVKLAIHNHGQGSPYGNPETVKKVLAARDARIGVCLDVGHVTGAGFDAAKVFHDYNGRVYDIHLKDKKVTDNNGKKRIDDVKIGTGDANYKGLFEELRKSNWNGVLAIETDNGEFAKHPDDYVSGAIDFVKNADK
jgi:sugar phosphate isomerase/epimerase